MANNLFMEMNLLNIIKTDGVELTMQGKTYRGRCPFHQGKTDTSLLVDAEAGKYHCFGCDQHGDAIQWLRDRRGLSFVEACKALGRDPGPRSAGQHRAPAPWTPKEVKTPSEIWQGRARTFLDQAIETLWSRHGDEMRRWLHDTKGLSDATIKQAGLGCHPADIYEPRAAWGLEPVLKEDGTERRQWLPAGLAIPLIDNGQVLRLRVRRDNADGPRYVIVSGSDMRPMILNPERAAAVIVESELDAILLSQETTGDLVTCISLGSASAKPDTTTHQALKAAAVILISLDADDPGARAAWAFWPATYGRRAKRWPCVKGKDPSEAWAGGLDLRQWVVAGIFGSDLKFERFCIQTVDGGLTDGEALKALDV